MSSRLWYPQLDVYDAIRRIGGLLSFWSTDAAPSPERLFIADFYLANPPLLHKTHMTREVRKEFTGLGIPRPEKAFISYPSPPILFQKMDEVQRQAFRTLTGKGLIDLPKLEKGAVAASAAGFELFEDRFVPLFGDAESQVAKFIARSFALADTDIGALRRSTGLRRVVR
ncbi:ABC-three component system middle component 5 [Parvibaculum lavamentivorans]|nr:ABC-three component system middle component 5 [Parvibaculum lavamentivorans]